MPNKFVTKTPGMERYGQAVSTAAKEANEMRKLRREEAMRAMPNKPTMPSQSRRPLGSFKKGGKVKKTGLYKLHKGERVVKAKKNKKK